MALDVGTKARMQLNSVDICKERWTAPRVEKTSVVPDVKYIRSTSSRFRDHFYDPWSLGSVHLPSVREKLCTGPEDAAIYYSGFCSWELNDGAPHEFILPLLVLPLGRLFKRSLSILDDKLNITFIFVATSCAREAIHTFMSFSWMHEGM